MTIRDHLKAGGLVAGMVTGALAIWTVSPVGWLWVASQMDAGRSPSMGAITVVLLGVCGTTLAIGKGLAVLHARYRELHHTRQTIRVHLPWLRSLRGERARETGADSVELTVLDVILVGSVLLAVGAYELWYLFLSTSPIDLRTGRE
ncbi:MAG: hypothetical protein QOH43_3677 [Solirubrobacteraceae bacterium]|jgi:hypothetical protein|nr:hypothetical protein [Solirubrobacteraceae bacterium]